MRIRVTRPRRGRTTIVLDDSRGVTGMHSSQRDVPVGDVRAVAKGLADTWHLRRSAIKEARKLRPV